jgi:hypothetical protein
MFSQIQSRPPDLNSRFSAPTVKRNRTHHLHKPDAQVTHIAYAHEALTGRATELTRRVTPSVQFESSKGPLATGRARSIVIGRAIVSDRPRDLQTL